MGELVNLRHLDISGTNLIEMPPHIVKLKSLQTLSAFILGKNGDSGINELRKLRQLKGSLSVLKLENAVHYGDDLEANLNDKLQLNELLLKWGHVSYNLVSINLRKCNYCLSLPPFGNLLSLKYLYITELNNVEFIDSEFYGPAASTSNPFGSLETLQLRKMLQLREWHHFRDNDGGAVAFPHLQHLYIQNCPNLTKGLPDGLFSLKTLVIDQCQQLRASLPSAPDIRELKLQNCRKVSFNKLPPQVLKLTIGGYEGLVSLPPIMFPLSSGIADTLKLLHLERCGKLLFPMHQCYASLESLCIICSCDSLELFSLDLFPKLNHLEIQECQSLLSLAVSN
nr:putative disease resistance protein [Quercus suber]